jgi:alpha-tubulin suppressor-like RCC1 family protein
MRRGVKGGLLAAALAAVLSMVAGCGDDGPFVSAGLGHTCAVTSKGALACWGLDDAGQVSGPNASTDKFTQVIAGGLFTCGLRTDGRIECWGQDFFGQGSGASTSTDRFTQLSGDLAHVCAVNTSRHIECWGQQFVDEVSGPNASTDSFEQVTTGDGETCGLKTDGGVECWGIASGETLNGDDYSQISGDFLQLCGVQSVTRRLHCGGIDVDGSVDGPNASTDGFIQVSVGSFTTTGPSYVAHTCGVKTNGRLECWGTDTSGEVSGPNASTDAFIQVSAGPLHTCALGTNGHVQCWGYDAEGQSTVPPADANLVFGNADTELEILADNVESFQLPSDVYSIIHDRIQYAKLQNALGHKKQACAATKDVAAVAKYYKHYGMTKDQSLQVKTAVAAIRASLGC